MGRGGTDADHELPLVGDDVAVDEGGLRPLVPAVGEGDEQLISAYLLVGAGDLLAHAVANPVGVCAPAVLRRERIVHWRRVKKVRFCIVCTRES